MYKKLVLFFLSLVSFCLLAPISSAFAADQVQVSLPSFTVTLNGQTTGNDYSKYPLIVYKNITYFPMTYYDCRLLGLKTDWTNNTGLIIEKNEDYFYEYTREVNDNKNASKQIAKIAADKITVNGKVIDNSTEEYPLLVFRDVTYFPLTWKFAVNEFGWNYTFDQKNGLVIQNDNVKLENPEDWELSSGSAGITGRGNGLTVRPHGPYLSNKNNAEDGIITISLKQIAEESKTLSKYNYGKLLSIQELQQLKTTPLPEKEIQKINSLEDTEKMTISISNIMPVTRNFIDAHMEYQIHKIVQKDEELTFRFILPSLNGQIEYEGWASYTFVTNFWLNTSLTPGTYKISIDHPEYFNYYETNNNEVQKLILNGPFPYKDTVEFEEFYINIIN